MHVKMIHCKAYRVLLADLRNARVAQGLRQEDVGRKLGLSADWVGKVEAGEIRLDLLHFVRLCRVYGAPADDIIRRFQEEVPA